MSSSYAKEGFEWLPAESQGAELSAEAMGGEQIIPTVMLTKTPKQTADLSQFTSDLSIDSRSSVFATTVLTPRQRPRA